MFRSMGSEAVPRIHELIVADGLTASDLIRAADIAGKYALAQAITIDVDEVRAMPGLLHAATVIAERYPERAEELHRLFTEYIEAAEEFWRMQA